MTLSVTTTRAAILHNSRSMLTIDDVVLPPKLFLGQVLVEVITSGICGAQINEIDAIKGPDKFLPHLLGHEGFGQVLGIGPGVTTVLPGDFVIMHWRPGAGIQALPAVYTWRGKKLNAGWVTTLNHHSVVSENRITKIEPRNHDKNVLPLLGCALTTALGVLKNDAKVDSSDSLLILGSGGVGLALIKVARFLKIQNIVVVDISDKKLKYALNLGATNVVKFINKDHSITELSKIFQKSLPSVAIDTTGNTDAIEICYEISAEDARVILVGVPKIDSRAKIYTLPLHFGKILKGSHGGGSKPEIEIPVLLDLISRGELNFDDYPIQTFKADRINEAIENLRNGVTGRMIIDFSPLSL